MKSDVGNVGNVGNVECEVWSLEFGVESVVECGV